ncbi:hypothetical protein KGM_200274 [Danaus plexippus plexippus]|uniref:Secreted protein n=1 Tax=Danaus plexippus plexippus TaxID=278856 RepID=A0A212EMK1_DANPL|nr:hypothetical protein KGM_200274 [Danaus plexippus plexippus]
MTHAFLVVVTIAISLKLLFLIFSLFVTLTTSSDTQTPGDLQTKQRKTNVMSIWKQTSQDSLANHSVWTRTAKHSV